MRGLSSNGNGYARRVFWIVDNCSAHRGARAVALRRISIGLFGIYL